MGEDVYYRSEQEHLSKQKIVQEQQTVVRGFLEVVQEQLTVRVGVAPRCSSTWVLFGLWIQIFGSRNLYMHGGLNEVYLRNLITDGCNFLRRI